MGKVVHVSTAHRARWCEGMKVEISANVHGWKHRFVEIVTLRNKTARVRSFHRGEEFEIRLTDVLFEARAQEEVPAGTADISLRVRDAELRSMRYRALHRGV